MSNTKHKCVSNICNNIINEDELLCEFCLDKFEAIVEAYPFVPGVENNNKI